MGCFFERKFSGFTFLQALWMFVNTSLSPVRLLQRKAASTFALTSLRQVDTRVCRHHILYVYLDVLPFKLPNSACKGIGILSLLIAELEAHPYELHLDRDGTYYEGLQCEAEHDPGLSEVLRELITSSRYSDEALAKLEALLENTNPMFGALTGTTQAVNIIQGGVKINALPETTLAMDKRPSASLCGRMSTLATRISMASSTMISSRCTTITVTRTWSM